MANTAVFPGSFDPITLGHTDIIERSLPLFDKVIVAIGVNTQKKSLFPLEERLDKIRQIYKNESKIEVAFYEGLTVDFCKKAGAAFIIRGLRSPLDFEYEKTIAQLNYKLKGIESICLISKPEYSHISSTIVREIYVHGGDITGFVPG